MSETIAKYRILGREGEPQRVDGQNRSVGDIVEMSAEAAEFYLREGRIEAVETRATKSSKRESGEA